MGVLCIRVPEQSAREACQRPPEEKEQESRSQATVEVSRKAPETRAVQHASDIMGALGGPQ
jgi:hypothetical protein